MQIAFLILLFIIGACLGSFVCCQARRLHYGTNGKGKTKKLGSRSVCLHCGYQLEWYDNIPIVSWLVLRGKCRKCHKKIGVAEIIAEISLALAFLLLGTTIRVDAISTLSWLAFVIILMLTTILAFLAIYDGLYGELPTPFLVIAIFCAFALLFFKEWAILTTTSFTPDLIWKPLLSVVILGGLYLVLYLVSKGKWVGDGDWLLGTAIGLALFEPWLALIALFLANFIACLIMYPFVRKKKQSKVYFGPFMVIAFVITLTFASFFESMI